MDRTLIHIDSPTEALSTVLFEIRGWIATTVNFDELRIDNWSLSLSQRPDVEQVHKDLPHIFGFNGLISIFSLSESTLKFSLLKDGKPIEDVSKQSHIKLSPTLNLSLKEKCEKFSTMYGENAEDNINKAFTQIASTEQPKSRKRYEPYLACPSCKTPIEQQAKKLSCHCDKQLHFDSASNSYSFNLQPIELNQNIASRSHDPLALALIGKYSDGLILDCGAGLPQQDFKNVVNFEIEQFGNTDVIGSATELPFLDDSFDAVFSLSVLEHIKDPFLAASEIQRVLKPQGIAYVNVPFEIPVHGYPNHYYNMTRNGIKNLFKELTPVVEGVPSSGHPLYAVSAMLTIWADHLPDQQKQQLCNLRVSDLIENTQHLIEADLSQQLPQSIQEVIACTNSIVFKKH